MIAFFYIDNYMVCVCSLESPQQGDSNENSQYTSMLEKLKNTVLIIFFCPGGMINTL